MYSCRTALTASFLALALGLSGVLVGGCPTAPGGSPGASSGNTDTNGDKPGGGDASGNDTSGGDASGNDTSGGDTSSGDGDTSSGGDAAGGGSDTGDAGGTGNAGDTGDAGGTGNTGDTGDEGGDDAAEFATAAIIHRGAGGFPADPKWGIPSADYFNETSSGIKTAVRIPGVSADGSRIWFVTQDNNAFNAPQLFVINSDGSNLQEIDLPLNDINRAPVELSPSADGQLCALLIDTGSGTNFSQSTIQIASRTTGQVTMLYDGRNLGDGDDDFADVQLTGDGLTVFFRNIETGIIHTLPAGGGSISTHTLLGEFTKSGYTPRELLHFRINADASALVANVEFEGGGAFPQDIYLKTALGVTAITNTGDAPESYPFEYLGASDDGRYIVYRRFFSSESRYGAYLLDVGSGQTRTLNTGDGSAQTLISGDGSLIYTSFATEMEYSNTDQLAGLAQVGGTGVLQLTEKWAGDSTHPPSITSMSSGGGVIVGTWANGGFGDPARLYAIFPNDTSYRDGPSISGVQYRLDAANGTLTVRATVSSDPAAVRFLSLYRGFESFYQLVDADPFYTERFGADMTATGEAGVYEITVDLGDRTIDDDYRVRITVADDTSGQNFAYVDFRPVPRSGETLDINGDGASD